jgi:hypothetical protein
MISSLLLTLSLLGQNSVDVNKMFWTVPPHIKDMVMTNIQEDWVFQQRKGFIYNWGNVLNEEDAEIIAMLDSKEYICRKHAYRHLKEMGVDSIKICSWGMNAKSAELREISALHMKILFKCTYCKGTGRVTKVFESYRPYDIPCRGCKESGNFLWFMDYDRKEQEYKWALRDIFGPTTPREDN